MDPPPPPRAASSPDDVGEEEPEVEWSHEEATIMDLLWRCEDIVTLVDIQEEFGVHPNRVLYWMDRLSGADLVTESLQHGERCYSLTKAGRALAAEVEDDR